MKFEMDLGSVGGTSIADRILDGLFLVKGKWIKKSKNGKKGSANKSANP